MNKSSIDKLSEKFVLHLMNLLSDSFSLEFKSTRYQICGILQNLPHICTKYSLNIIFSYFLQQTNLFLHFHRFLGGLKWAKSVKNRIFLLNCKITIFKNFWQVHQIKRFQLNIQQVCQRHAKKLLKIHEIYNFREIWLSEPFHKGTYLKK